MNGEICDADEAEKAGVLFAFVFAGEVALAVDGAEVVAGEDFDVGAFSDDDGVAIEGTVWGVGYETLELEGPARGSAEDYTRCHCKALVAWKLLLRDHCHIHE